jgi:hypothetical protein
MLVHSVAAKSRETSLFLLSAASATLLYLPCRAAAAAAAEI